MRAAVGREGRHRLERATRCGLGVENVTVPKFDRWALLQKINRQVSGASAIHSAELLASLPVWVVENFHPSLLVMANV